MIPSRSSDTASFPPISEICGFCILSLQRTSARRGRHFYTFLYIGNALPGCYDAFIGGDTHSTIGDDKMKALVVYDSQFGNTEKIARAISDALAAEAETTLLRAAAATPQALTGYDLIVVGSPTQRFHATETVAGLLEGLSLPDVRAAAFDTRFDRAEVDNAVLRFAIKAAGDNAWAATRISDLLEKAGATVVAPPEGFIVQGTEGPLRDGELERAAEWATRVLVTALAVTEGVV